jgi:hypothetical protein
MGLGCMGLGCMGLGCMGLGCIEKDLSAIGAGTHPRGPEKTHHRVLIRALQPDDAHNRNFASTL